MTFRYKSMVGKCGLILILVLCNKSEGQNTKDSIYTTCDLDLENIESLLQYLPAICTEIYQNRIADPALYQSYMDEAKAFAKFNDKLNNFELGPQHNPHEGLQQYPFDKELRLDIYRKVNWADCVTSANTSATEYLNCVKAKRNELQQLVPGEGSE